jgi:hypothetical protein
MHPLIWFLSICSIACSEIGIKGSFHTESYAARPIMLAGTGTYQQTGCWIRMYDEEHFRGQELLMHSGRSLRNFQFQDIEDWRGRVRSFEVGPEARVTFYEQESFAEPLLKVEPARRFRGDFGRNLNQARSMQLDCIKNSKR